MEQLLCCICQRPYHPRRPGEWYCNSCWHKFNEDIVNNAEWVVYCRAWEAYRRRLENHTYMEDGVVKRAEVVHIGDDDVAETNGVGKIVYKYRED